MLDKQLILHNGSVATSTGAKYSDYEIDFEIADPNFGKGRAIEVIGVATATLTGDTDTTIKFSIVHSAAEDATDDLSGTLYTVGSASTVSPGTELFRYVLADEHKRYVRAKIDNSGAVSKNEGVAIYLQPRW